VFKDILFTVDLEHSASWERALPVALHETRASAAQLHLLTVVPEVAVPALMQVGPFDYETQLVPKATAALEQFVREQVPADVPARPIATYGSVYQEILRIAAELPVDLIARPSPRRESLGYRSPGKTPGARACA
jgi:nucleotide-binding universal stress UspA family protein